MNEHEARQAQANIVALNLLMIELLAEATSENPNGKVARLVSNPGRGERIIPPLPEPLRGDTWENLHALLSAALQQRNRAGR